MLFIFSSNVSHNAAYAQVDVEEIEQTIVSTDILKNGNFDQKTSGDEILASWVVGGRETALIRDIAGEFVANRSSTPTRGDSSWLGFSPHSGEYALEFGNIDPSRFQLQPGQEKLRTLAQRDRAWQQLEIPIGERATLRFMYRIISQQAACDMSSATVAVRQITQKANILATFNICQSNQNPDWQLAEIDLSAYMGKDIIVLLESAIQETNVATGWVVDSAELIVDFPPASPLPDENRIYLPIARNARPVSNTPFVLDCKPSGGSGGHAPGSKDYYVEEIAGLQTALIVGRNYNPAKPTLLTFYLHGDGGDFDSFIRYTPLRNLIHTQGWIHVGVLAPNLHGESYISWKEGDVRRKAEMLTRVFDEIYARYNVCQGVTLGSGASGGSVAYTGYFLPLIGDRYPSFFLAHCGGSYPPEFALSGAEEDNWLGLFGQNPQVAGRLGVRFIYSSNDFVADEVERTILGYESHGILTHGVKTSSEGHCGDPFIPLVPAYWLPIAKTVVMP